ncbi:uncharacterized protein BDV17DRAFT_20607 [Aspergillus undulatus]|uniref:uncharacterized protein n=1 Tax=Aspergillus undulatus TaxID=1810928 RepID=UPI003CCE20DF
MDGSTSNTTLTLYDFQSMILETTEIQARGAVERLTRSWVVQTVANLQQSFTPSDERNRSSVDDSLWRPWRVPLFLTPTFETCNISRDYKLEIRLGIGLGGNNMRIVEFQFPVYIVAVSGQGSSASIEAPALELEYYGKEDLLDKEMELEGYSS